MYTDEGRALTQPTGQSESFPNTSRTLAVFWMAYVRALSTLLTGIILLIGSTALAARGDQGLDLVIGQQKVISAPGVSRIAVGNPDVADVKVVSADQVLVTAVGVGETELTVWRGNRMTKYGVLVTRMDPRELRREVLKLIGNREGISVRV
ncbi:MAG: pilus assembly protein N-terminal domain-containing protein, partial [Myxococcota bacterium]